MTIITLTMCWAFKMYFQCILFNFKNSMRYTVHSSALFFFLIRWGNRGSEENLSATTQLASSSSRILSSFYLFAGPKVSTNIPPWEARHARNQNWRLWFWDHYNNKLALLYSPSGIYFCHISKWFEVSKILHSSNFDILIHSFDKIYCGRHCIVGNSEGVSLFSESAV